MLVMTEKGCESWQRFVGNILGLSSRQLLLEIRLCLSL